jgi:Tol biopolymer transport system component
MPKIIALLLAATAPLPVSSAALVSDVSSSLSDYNLSFDDAERTMVFARSEADFRNARILISVRSGGRWTKPQPIGFTDERHSDSDPWLTPDGETLYFISTRPAPGRDKARTDYDIWRAQRTGFGWSEPEHLGASVNSLGQELGPELHGKTLYFSSARKSGRGGLDIYAAAKAPGGFAPARLLDGPFNGASSESDFTLSRDGRWAMFWRSGEGETAAIHIAQKAGDAWSEPTPLSAAVNNGPFNFTPSFSRDGRKIRYASTRQRDGQAEGLADIYEAPLEFASLD